MTAQNKSISQLNNLEEGTDNDYLLILNNGEDKKITFLNFLKNLTKGKIGLGEVKNVDTTTTANILDSTDKRFVTDAQRAILQTEIAIIPGLDTDPTLAANSDTLIASQKATKSYADTKVPQTRTVNSKALSSDITLDASDVGAPSGSGTSTGDNTGDQTKASLGLENVDNTSDATKNAAIATLTNKRIPPRVVSATSYTTDTGTSLNCDTTDIFIVTAQAGALKLNNPTGTPTDGQKLWIAVTGTAARVLTYDTQFEASTYALPTTTVTTARLDMGFVWRADTSKWRIAAIA